MELSKQTKIAIIKSKLEQYQQQLFDIQLDHKVASALDDERLRNNAEEKTKRVILAIETIEQELDAIQN